MSRKRRAAVLEPTGIEGAAVVFAGAAFVNVGLGALLIHQAWLGPIAGKAFCLLGLELAAVALTTATVALALGPVWGVPAARKAWAAGASALGLSVAGVLVVFPGLLGPVP